MEKLHKDKINTAIGLCEKRFTQFCAAVEARYSKEEASQIKYFLLQNTVFSGGVFRSIFTETPVKDIDIFFTSLDASLEFQDRFMKPHAVPKGLKPLFLPNDITEYNTFNWYGASRKDPPLSFITKEPDEPMVLINKFDFTFNQHYFNLNTYEMCFDIDTFQRIGEYNVNCTTWKDRARIFQRALKFMDAGLKINSGSMMYLIQQIAGKDLTGLMEEEFTDGSGGPQTASSTLPLTGKRYKESDYFGVKKVVERFVATEWTGDGGVFLNAAAHPIYQQPATEMPQIQDELVWNTIPPMPR